MSTTPNSYDLTETVASSFMTGALVAVDGGWTTR
jgi:hypothetical protein